MRPQRSGKLTLGVALSKLETVMVVPSKGGKASVLLASSRGEQDRMRRLMEVGMHERVDYGGTEIMFELLSLRSF